MQDWPAYENAPEAVRRAASSRSASEWTTTAAFPPTARDTLVFGTRDFRRHPTAPEPVNETTGRRGSKTSPSAAAPEIGRTAYASAGQPASRTISLSASAESGVFEAGFWTTGAPTAIAGATLCDVRLSGKLKGVMARIWPTGTRFTTPQRPSEAAFTSSGSISPTWASSAAAAAENVAAARSASEIGRAH